MTTQGAVSILLPVHFLSISKAIGPFKTCNSSDIREYHSQQAACGRRMWISSPSINHPKAFAKLSGRTTTRTPEIPRHLSRRSCFLSERSILSTLYKVDTNQIYSEKLHFSNAALHLVFIGNTFCVI